MVWGREWRGGRCGASRGARPRRLLRLRRLLRSSVFPSASRVFPEASSADPAPLRLAAPLLSIFLALFCRAASSRRPSPLYLSRPISSRRFVSPPLSSPSFSPCFVALFGLAAPPTRAASSRPVARAPRACTAGPAFSPLHYAPPRPRGSLASGSRPPARRTPAAPPRTPLRSPLQASLICPCPSLRPTITRSPATAPAPPSLSILGPRPKPKRGGGPVRPRRGRATRLQPR